MSFAPHAGDREITELEIRPVGPGTSSAALPPQRLEIDNGWSPSNQFILRAVDLNFDGTLDLGFGPVLGTPNLSLSYWVWTAAGGWMSVGTFSNLRQDVGARELIAHEKGGHAGMLSKEEAYLWQDTKLVLVRSVEQVAVPGKPEYRKTTRTFANGKQLREESESVAAPRAAELIEPD